MRPLRARYRGRYAGRPDTPSLAVSVLAGLMLLTLPGCRHGGPDDAALAYLAKLGAALPAAERLHQPGEFTAAPDPHFSPIDIAANDQGPFDVLDLVGCALKRTVIRENSLLGRHAKPSQRLLLVLEYLRLAPDCIARLRWRGDDAVAARLAAALHQRHRDLPAYLFNATLASAEFRVFLSAAPPPGTYPRVAPPAAAAALGNIALRAERWLARDYRADDRAFELHLGEVAGGAGGVLLRALQRQAAVLARADRLLGQQLRRDPDCRGRGNRRESARLLAAARRHFHAETLPRYAATRKRLDALIAPLARLEATLQAVAPADYRRWRSTRSARVRALRRVPARHLALLARAERACSPGGVMPKAVKIGYTLRLPNHGSPIHRSPTR